MIKLMLLKFMNYATVQPFLDNDFADLFLLC